MAKLPQLDLSGQRFGRWTVTCLFQQDPKLWSATCDCGHIGHLQQAALTQGRTKSCQSCSSKARATHGASSSSEMKSYYHMRERCLSPTCHDYSYYGGRGIKICDRWLNDSCAFLTDMGPKPTGYTLERLDVNGHYEPSNCIWASRLDQCNNTRITNRYTIDGQTKTHHDWCKELDLYKATVHARIIQQGQSPEEALSYPTPRRFDGSYIMILAPYRSRRRNMANR